MALQVISNYFIELMDNRNSDEINLIDFIKNTLQFLVNNKIIIGVCFIVFLLFGIYKVKSNPEKYEPTFTKEYIAYNPFVKIDLVENIFNNYSATFKSLSNENIDEVALLFNLEKGVVENLTDFKVIRLILLEEKEEIKDYGILFSITTKNKNDFESIKEGIKYNLLSNSFVKDKYEIIHEQLIKQLTFIDSKADSATNTNNKHTTNSSDEFTYLAISERSKIKNLLDKQFIEYIDTNSPIVADDGKSRARNIIILFGFIGIVCGIGLALLLSMIRLLKK